MESSLRARIAALTEAEPALADDLAVRGTAIAILDGASVDTPPPVLPGARVRAKLEWGTPLLDGEAVSVPAEATATFERLAVAWLADPSTRDGAEAVLRALREHRLHGDQLLGEALAGHDDHLSELADAAGVPAPLLAMLADLAVRPLLVSLAARLRTTLSLGRWERGYCPICGAWPLLAERLEDGAELRCGRCLTRWAWPLPQCPHCTTGHLASVDTLTGPNLGAWSADGCNECHTYLKMASREQPGGLAATLLDDLATWALDRAAIGQGLGRPDGAGYRLELLDLEEELDDD